MEEEEDGMEEILQLPVPVPAVPVPAVPVPAVPVSAVPVEFQPEGPAPGSACEPNQEETVAPRRSSRGKSAPNRLVVTRNGKSYVDAVNHNLVKAERARWGKEDVSGRGVQHCQCQAACHLRGQALVHANLSRMVLNSVYELQWYNKI